MSSKKIFFGCIIVVLLGVIIYNLPYFREGRAYDKVVSGKDYDGVEYFDNYPTGRHAQEVYVVLCDRAYESKDKMDLSLNYVSAFPDGKYIDTFNNRIDSIYDIEINNYINSKTDNSDPEAVKYMTEMLQFMKEKRLNKIIVDVEYDIKLKDYKDYDEDIRQFIELFDDGKLSYTNDMLSLKSNFSSEDVKTLQAILINGVEESFEKLFTENIIKIEPMQYSIEDNIYPKLVFNYTIKNQEFVGEDYALPHIWVYATNNIPQKLLLGVEVLFDAKFTIPNSSTEYHFAELGEPTKDIDNIEDIQEGYRIMSQMCFAEFSNKMSQNLGLKETYFQGEYSDDPEY